LRRFRFSIVLVVVAFVATGCIRSDLTVNVNDDGSGTYSAIVALNPKAFAELAKFSGQNTGELGDDPCKEIRTSAIENQGDLPAGAKVENYTDGDFCGVKITAPFAAGDNPSAEISKALGGIDAATEGFSGIGLDSFDISKSDSGWKFQAAPTGSTTGAASTTGDAAMFQSFLKGASSIVRIKLPGRLVESDSNPDAVDGSGALIWNLSLAGETRTLKARTEAGDPIKNKIYTDAGKNLPNIKGAGGATSSSKSSSIGGSSSDGGSSKVPLTIGAFVAIAAIVGFVLWRKSKAGTTPPAAAGPPMGGTAPEFPAPASPPSPSPEGAGAAAAAVGQPQWDAARNAYILWDAGSSKWLQYDNAAAAWTPIE